ncbi:hypothetical protein [Listeria fleischmannii]|uniref:Uncharacterized protein n=2 Tax=Listeria fleischmannii TaxID=1069827 RepID=W7DJ00_9LIST|nr:hypothetical protein [Listeria fleischmannii]EIA19450.1 hypothetical protein KKC_12320 [Listeria fleischmannii subsp. coloradonensis]EUJ51537.1 hypothetical protein MCOL2_15627 [Listeria fleischmannii FSL S10-1203]MBC1399057.1 hypothetical protein [Listeria fleischmannii]MBC1420029.1 hypothetical protein [Listeria fleischmannii]MBC1427310.1 hypothetical protein [Listeria fleischmannii]
MEQNNAIFQGLETGEAVLLVTGIGYIVGIVEKNEAALFLGDVYINCLSASRINRFSKGLTVNKDQVIGLQKLTQQAKNELIGAWQAAISPTAG